MWQAYISQHNDNRKKTYFDTGNKVLCHKEKQELDQNDMLTTINKTELNLKGNVKFVLKISRQTMIATPSVAFIFVHNVNII